MRKSSLLLLSFACGAFAISASRSAGAYEYLYHPGVPSVSVDTTVLGDTPAPQDQGPVSPTTAASGDEMPSAPVTPAEASSSSKHQLAKPFFTSDEPVARVASPVNVPVMLAPVPVAQVPAPVPLAHQAVSEVNEHPAAAVTSAPVRTPSRPHAPFAQSVSSSMQSVSSSFENLLPPMPHGYGEEQAAPPAYQPPPSRPLPQAVASQVYAAPPQPSAEPPALPPKKHFAARPVAPKPPVAIAPPVVVAKPYVPKPPTEIMPMPMEAETAVPSPPPALPAPPAPKKIVAAKPAVKPPVEVKTVDVKSVAATPAIIAEETKPVPAPAPAVKTPVAALTPEETKSAPPVAAAAKTPENIDSAAASNIDIDAEKTPVVAVEQPSFTPAPAGKTAAVPNLSDLSLVFDTTASTLSPQMQLRLDTLVDQIKDADMRLQIRGFAKGDASDQSSARRMALSRALAVRSYLMDKGIKPVRLDVRALGSETDQTPIDRVDLVFTR